MAKLIQFDPQTRRVADERARNLSKTWFCHQGIDHTVYRGQSLGSVIELQVFLQARKTGRQFCGRLIYGKKMVRAIFSCLMLLIRERRFVKSNFHVGADEYVFVLTKSSPQSSVVKPLLPVIRGLVKGGAKVVLLTGSQATKAELACLVPGGRVVNIVSSDHRRFFGQVSYLCRIFFFGIVASGERRFAYANLLHEAPELLFAVRGLDTLSEQAHLLVAATERHVHERFIMEHMKARGVAFILFQHGVTEETVKNIMVNTPSQADKIFAWGELSKQFFLHHGVCEEKIVVTGSPIFDNFTVLNRDQLAPIFEKYRLPRRPTIFFSGQNFLPEKNTQLIKIVLESFNNLLHQDTDFKPQLLISPHPASAAQTSESYYEALVHESGLKLDENVFIRRIRNNIEKVLQISDVVISSSSTLHVFSALSRKSTILLNIDDVSSMDAVNIGAALEATNKESLINHLRTLLYNKEDHSRLENQEKFVRQYCHWPHYATDDIIKDLREFVRL